MYIVVIGNYVWAYGPFASRDEALAFERYIETNQRDFKRWQDYSTTVLRVDDPPNWR